LTDIWLWTPWFTLLLLAGLQSLPKEPFEAAAIDGTTTWRVFRPPRCRCRQVIGLRGDPRHRRLPHLRHRLTRPAAAGHLDKLFSLYAIFWPSQSRSRPRPAAAIIGGLIISCRRGLYRLSTYVAKPNTSWRW
jgi:multiple sugar transport system permease protein